MSTLNPVRMAELAQRTLTKEGDEGFRMEQAVLFAYCAEGFRVLATAGDIYEGLASLPFHETLNAYEEGIGIITTGWASPIPPDCYEGDAIAPSEHPLRRRVRLSSCVTREGKMGSAMAFQADPDDLVTDEGEATGSLAQALHIALLSLIAKQN